MQVPMLLLLFISLVHLGCASQAHSSGISSSLSAKLQMKKYRPSEGPAPAPAYLGPIVAPRHKSKLRHRYQHRHRHRHRHRLRPYAVSPNPDAQPGCDQICSDPFTPTAIGTPCGCVIPMKVRDISQTKPGADSGCY